MIFVDSSSSMNDVRHKIVSALPRATNELQRKCQNYKISVNPLMYVDNSKNNLEPRGTPAFITHQTPNGPELIKQRILNEMAVKSSHLQEGQVPSAKYETAHSFYEEIILGTLAEAVPYNSKNLQGQDAVATLVVTDALPAFETYENHRVLSNIQSSIGTATYVSGILAPDFTKKDLWEMTSSCGADTHGLIRKYGWSPQVKPPYPDIKTTLGWTSHSPYLLNEFTQLVGREFSYYWDICKQSPDSSFDDFIDFLIERARCEDLIVNYDESSTAPRVC